MPTRIMTRRQLAAYLNVRTRTVAEWERLGMPVLLGGTRVLRYNPEAVVKWMEERGRARADAAA